MRTKRVYRAKKKKSIFRNKYFWTAFLVLVIFLFSFYIFIFSHFFQIDKINVSGNKEVKKESIELLANQNLESKFLFASTKSIFMVNLPKIKNDILKKFPKIKNIKIERKFPRALNIIIKERIPKFIFCKEKTCFLMDDEGVIFEKSSLNNNFLLIRSYLNKNSDIQLGKNVMAKENLSKISKIEFELKKLKININAAVIEEPHKLVCKSENGPEIYFDLSENISQQIFNLKTVLEERISPEELRNLKYIDLRFGNRIFWK